MLLDLIRSVFNRRSNKSPRYVGEDIYIGPTVFGIDSLPFEVPAAIETSSLKIDLADTNHLHLANLLFKIDGTWISLQDCDDLSFEQSSVVKNQDVFDVASLAKGESAFFSTRMEESPYIIVRFPEVKALESIRIVNRRDGLWGRAKNIRVSAVTDGRWRVFYDGSCFQSRLAWLKFVIEDLQDDAESPQEVKSLVSDLKYIVRQESFDVARVYEALESFLSKFGFPADAPDSVNFLGSGLAYSLSRVIGFFHSSMEVNSTRFLIDMLVCQGNRRDAFKLYSIASRSLVESKLKCIEDDVDAIGRQKYKHPLIPAAHTFARPLSSYPRDTLLDTIDAVVNCLEGSNCALLLCYGTLLGFYRDNDFIAHDDDIDLLCITNVGREELKEASKEIAGWLNNAGFRAQINFNNRREKLPFIQVFSKLHKVHLDIFLAYKSEEEIFLPMRNVNYSSVPACVLQPITSKEFFGRKYAVPAKIEKFLEARYGVTWNVPDKHFRANEHGKR